jgi:LysM repeat protein
MSYKVRSGDTLSAIAQRNHVSLAALEKANKKIKNPNAIQVGESINIPGKKDSFEHGKKAAGKSHSGAKSKAGSKTHKSSGASPVKQTVPGNVGKWIAQAQAILQKAGVPMSKMNARDIAIIIQHESSGNPSAINRWDSNAAAGHPSEGLMQTIGPTFNSYKLPGHDQILNPVDNIIAGVRYAISRYGSISNVPGVRDVHAGRAYVGY